MDDSTNAVTIAEAAAQLLNDEASTSFTTTADVITVTITADADAITAATGGITQAELGGSSILINGDNAIALTKAEADSVSSPELERILIEL